MSSDAIRASRGAHTTALLELYTATKRFPTSWRELCAVDSLARALYWCGVIFHQDEPRDFDDALLDDARELYRSVARELLTKGCVETLDLLELKPPMMRMKEPTSVTAVDSPFRVSRRAEMQTHRMLLTDDERLREIADNPNSRD